MGCPSGAGDRYLLKLFRDFVFHQMDEEGRPILDWGHMVEALNKLDAAVPEQVSCLLGFVCVCVFAVVCLFASMSWGVSCGETTLRVALLPAPRPPVAVAFLTACPPLSS